MNVLSIYLLLSLFVCESCFYVEASYDYIIPKKGGQKEIGWNLLHFTSKITEWYVFPLGGMHN